METTKKDLEYYRKNAEEDYLTTPISVLRYISEMELAFRQPLVVGRSEQLVCDRCNGEHNNITPCPKCGGLSESLFEAN